MTKNSKIEWTNHTFNPIMGCTKVSPACKFCYAERDTVHKKDSVIWGDNGTRVLTSDSYWRQPIAWNSEAEANGIRYRVFCASLSDVFEDWDGRIINTDGKVTLCSYGDGGKHWVYEGQSKYPGGYDWCDLNMQDVRRRLFKLIDSTPHLDWLLLTKRPENISKMWDSSKYRSNVWLGTSVENQKYADIRIPQLLENKKLASILFLSCEPLLGPVDLKPFLNNKFDKNVNWVICGGESGPEARPMHPQWARTIRDDCKSANVAFHFKQWGEFGPEETALPKQIDNTTYHVCENGERLYRVGRKQAGRILDGNVHDDIPTLIPMIYDYDK